MLCIQLYSLFSSSRVKKQHKRKLITYSMLLPKLNCIWVKLGREQYLLFYIKIEETW